ncbi:MAG: flagellar hook-length control protein FliK [Myxococcales bacterium]|nr:flagellar hook-length control protein FliK [Myxococcales bacterium]
MRGFELAIPAASSSASAAPETAATGDAPVGAPFVEALGELLDGLESAPTGEPEPASPIEQRAPDAPALVALPPPALPPPVPAPTALEAGVRAADLATGPSIPPLPDAEANAHVPPDPESSLPARFAAASPERAADAPRSSVAEGAPETGNPTAADLPRSAVEAIEAVERTASPAAAAAVGPAAAEPLRTARAAPLTLMPTREETSPEPRALPVDERADVRGESERPTPGARPSPVEAEGAERILRPAPVEAEGVERRPRPEADVRGEPTVEPRLRSVAEPTGPSLRGESPAGHERSEAPPPAPTVRASALPVIDLPPPASWEPVAAPREVGTAREALPVHAEWLAARGGGSARLRLHPPELGEVELTVRVRGNDVQVSIHAEREAAGRAVLDGRELLVEALAARDLRVDQFAVRTTEGSSVTSDPRDPGGSPGDGGRRDDAPGQREGEPRRSQAGPELAASHPVSHPSSAGGAVDVRV